MGNRLPGLRDDDFFALADAIEELNDVGGSFRESGVGDHGVDLLRAIHPLQTVGEGRSIHV